MDLQIQRLDLGIFLRNGKRELGLKLSGQIRSGWVERVMGSREVGL